MQVIKRILFFIIGFIVFNVQAQQLFELTSQEADCKNAIDITGLNDIAATAPVGSGENIEIHSSQISLYAFKTEHNIVWYKFEVLYTCELSFIITPNNSKDDYDFVLYLANDKPICTQIQKSFIKPIRTNISRPNSRGSTGLSSESQVKYVHQGKGSSFSKSLSVVKGQVYYLVLDNVYGTGDGHSISFQYNNCKEGEAIKSALLVNIKVIDKDTKEPIEAHVLMVEQSRDMANNDTIYNKVSHNAHITIKSGRIYECEVWAEGYLKAKEIVKLNPNDKPLFFDVELQAVEVGKSFEIGNLYFEGGTAAVVRKSRSALRSLLYIMKDNPSLEIEIQGHVNLTQKSRKKKPETYYTQLSIDRAKAVYDYLNKRGISQSRMSYRGFGYDQMIFPEAITEEQMQRNRRVVVRIIKL